MPEIIGVIAGFVMAEALSAFLAATPTGLGQLAAVMIQLILALLGAKGVIDAAIQAAGYGRAWLERAWLAKGDEKQLALASKDFLRMLVAIAMAALAFTGMNGNVGKAWAMSGSFAAPSKVVAMGNAGAGAGAAASMGVPGPAGPIGVAGAQMVKHEGEGGASKQAPAKTEPARAEPARAEPAKAEPAKAEPAWVAALEARGE